MTNLKLKDASIKMIKK